MNIKGFKKAFKLDMQDAVRETMGVIASTSAEEATAMFGHYDNGADWPELSSVTVDIHREEFAASISNLGFGSFDTPLVRTGELMKSIKSGSTDTTAEVGTNNPLMSLHELGIGVPARPVFGPVVNKMEDKVQAIFNASFEENLGRH